jgi:hypothetical protein
MPWKYWNMMLEKDGKDQLDWACETWRSITQSQGGGGEEYPMCSKKKKD